MKWIKHKLGEWAREGAMNSAKEEEKIRVAMEVPASLPYHDGTAVSLVIARADNGWVLQSHNRSDLLTGRIIRGRSRVVAENESITDHIAAMLVDLKLGDSNGR